jgi:putative N6-adenine-specific DNA methylase
MSDYQKNNTYFAQIADGLEATGAANWLNWVRSTFGRFVAASISRPIDHRFTASITAPDCAPVSSRRYNRLPAPTRRSDLPGGPTHRLDTFFSLDQTFAVFASTAGSTVPHSQFAGLKLKDAVADQFRDAFGRRPNVDPRNADLWINLHVQKDRGTISVDTSGGSLHRRGYRTRSGDAPMQETVAAAMVRLSEWDGRVPLADPMCGSGTLI